VCAAVRILYYAVFGRRRSPFPRRRRGTNNNNNQHARKRTHMYTFYSIINIYIKIIILHSMPFGFIIIFYIIYVYYNIQTDRTSWLRVPYTL